MSGFEPINNSGRGFFDILANSIEPKYGSSGISIYDTKKTPIINEEKPSFNAVIEGTFHDDWSNAHLKLSSLNVLEDIALVDDGVYKYRIYGKSSRLVKGISDVNYKKDSNAKVESLTFSKGIVLDSASVPQGGFLERPRMFCMRDGRIYVEEGMITQKEYFSSIVPHIVASAENIFGNSKWDEIYKNVLHV
ncbi:MAG: hypothetical protein WA139_00995 [Candidatus Aenigmatarchaeota archaeon]